jgi:Xaa-Pro dipeptidase
MALTRRTALAASFAVAGAAALAARTAFAQPASTAPAQPIGQPELLARMAKAQRLMQAQGVRALVIEPGAAMIYFTGVRWRRSERPTVAVIPREGEPLLVMPHFEEPSVRESLRVPAQVRPWHEDQDAMAVAADWLRSKGLASGPVAFEETTRWFVAERLLRAAPGLKAQSGDPVVRPCRMIKSPTELALMQRATDITIAAYRETIPQVRPGMTPRDVSQIMDAATRRLGGEVEFSLVLMGPAAAYPHGTGQPQVAEAGGVVLMDCGCNVFGYQSDVSRTFVLGEASKRQREVWDQVHRGQEIALAAAKVGAPAGAVDDAVRGYYTKLGYGPGEALPGLSHRTGHGIGLDGHEPVNLVHGETTPLAPGMCFSNEPGLYIPGAFGVRLEDCFHMTEAGPKWFSEPPRSLDEPFR